MAVAMQGCGVVGGRLRRVGLGAEVERRHARGLRRVGLGARGDVVWGWE